MCSDRQLKPECRVRKQSHISAWLRSCRPVFWGHQWSSRRPPISCAWERRTLDFQRMSFPSILACTPHSSGCSPAWLEERGGGTFSTEERGEKSSRIETSYSIGCETGNYSEVLLGVPQWTRTLSTGQECNCMSHRSLSFTQCQRRLPFKILSICQESTLFKYTCNSTWTTSPPSRIPLHSMKQNKTKNKTTLNGWSCGFQFQLPCWLSSHLQRRTKKGTNCYGNKLMFWDYSFHYRKRSIWKRYTGKKRHTKFPYQTLLILARSSLPSPVAKPDPKCHTFPSQPLPICLLSLPVNWVTCCDQARSEGKNGGGGGERKQHKNNKTRRKQAQRCTRHLGICL